LLNGNSTITARAAPYFRPHSSLNGKTPIEVASEHSANAPFWDEVEKEYDPTKERIREQAYWRDKKMNKYGHQKKTWFCPTFPS